MFNNPAAEAMFNTGLDNLISKTDANTKRMAGAALLAALTPSIMSSLDNHEESFLGEALSGAITLGGIGTGAYTEHALSQLSEGEKELLIQLKMDDLKKQSKETMKRDGPVVANEKFGHAKQKMLDDFEPIDTNKGRRKVMREVAQFDLLGMTPRTVRATARGALLGGLATIPIAYAPLKGEEIE